MLSFFSFLLFGILHLLSRFVLLFFMFNVHLKFSDVQKLQSRENLHSLNLLLSDQYHCPSITPSSLLSFSASADQTEINTNHKYKIIYKSNGHEGLGRRRMGFLGNYCSLFYVFNHTHFYIQLIKYMCVLPFPFHYILLI